MASKKQQRRYEAADALRELAEGTTHFQHWITHGAVKSEAEIERKMRNLVIRARSFIQHAEAYLKEAE